MHLSRLQTPRAWRWPSLEGWLEAERDQLVLWIPVMLGGGIAAWFVLPDAAAWTAFVLAGIAVAVAGVVFPLGGRAGRVLLIAGLAAALGCALVWWRAERVAAPVLARAAIAEFTARVERIDALAARDLVRLRLAPVGAVGLPGRVRVNLATKDVPAGLTRGAVVRLRARLMPPPGAAVPGAYDFARVAWFDGLGATGRGVAPVTIVRAGEAPGGDLRARLSAHIQSRVPGGGGAIAASLATGDQGGIPDDDAEAMRRSGLAHLLSVSGLHITAVVGATMLIVLRLLALSPWAALHWRLPLVAAGAGALAAIGYTLLTGSEVPTVRSCIAALLVLAALALGREAVTLRLVAAGALVVLLIWPQAVVGASFQLSFAAVTAIVALHESVVVRGWFAPREEGGGRRLLRSLASLLATGLIVELALMPIGLFHFHKAGAYGALANIVAIPLTTFVVMPLEVVALLLDTVGLGAPVWWLAGRTLALLLWIAHTTANAPGAVAALPAMPRGAFGLMAVGGLWIALWRTRVRFAGVLPLVVGAVWAFATPPPDLIVTGDGRHLAIRTRDGGMALLRERAGDYVRDLLAEGGGVDGELPAIDDIAGARCNSDLCLMRFAGRASVLATRSGYFVEPLPLIRLCRKVDIVVSDRTLPRGCKPAWLKLDRGYLKASGGVTVSFDPPRIVSVAGQAGDHPWVRPATIMPPLPPRPPRKSRSRDGHPAAVAPDVRASRTQMAHRRDGQSAAADPQ
ncbi:ComEC family competence protein [Sphingomonas donggukensis]|uniref:ComEC family competence protein n=1 Tax=Sphingomonas donggukensis TaxID=2949093 RepID=A0ABY4U1E1_9SPHN|nr:ComEC/Rec2 family competence protein [Sphingomonas donggukensis]URW76363.1 ComEC family competence protein [Sphingomonas donggukensis]